MVATKINLTANERIKLAFIIAKNIKITKMQSGEFAAYLENSTFPITTNAAMSGCINSTYSNIAYKSEIDELLFDEGGQL